MSRVSDKIKSLRSQSGLSQEQIAELMNMSRVTYNSLEKGKRDVKKQELENLASIFETTVGELLSEPQEDRHIASDHPQYKLMQTILYVLTQCAGKPNVGKVVLNKLLYFADFNHYEKYWESISGDTYIKMPMGPVPKSVDSVLALLEQSGYIQAIKSKYHGYVQHRFIPTVSPDLTAFRATETQEMDEVIEMYGDKNGARMTDFSHEDMPYQGSEHIGDEIPYDLVHYRSPLYSVTVDDDERD